MNPTSIAPANPSPREASTRFTPSALYRVVSIAEAITWTILITVMVLKYGFGIEGWYTFTGGLVHGFVFITYGASVIVVGLNQRWPIGRILFGIVTAIVPYATVPFDLWLEKRKHLVGQWRTEKTDDPRDAGWVDTLLRWFLRHPLLLGAVMILAVIAVVSVLLILGPPGEWGQ